MDTDQEFFFKACYLADYDLLKTFPVSDSSRKFTFTFLPTSSYAIFTGSLYLHLSPAEILKMSYDAWYDLKDKTELVGDYRVNPSLVFGNILKCLEWLQVNLSAFEVDYFSYHNLQHALSDDIEWFDEREYLELLAQGFRHIDIDLYNAARKFNIPKVIDLMRMGADPNIDLYQEGEDSTLFNSIDIDASFNLIEYLNCHEACLNNNVSSEDFTHMVSYLYGAAGTELLIQTILKYKA